MQTLRLRGLAMRADELQRFIAEMELRPALAEAIHEELDQLSDAADAAQVLRRYGYEVTAEDILRHKAETARRMAAGDLAVPPWFLGRLR
ncbi:Nif11-like leader peptide family natural product precursor [Pseudoroseomonas cervicalis]|uniref:Nif11-like leader peptide family natural product precursor n=1 Tax=Teichococcus cervicalis TaxID=204525 RepID=UPI0022F18A7F|nr:Nif11-like leader peptide family natural product precursor [Pseudoroseomonas cervicalis]WBV42132.1 Nif11-like leader peptide family natural product precursor [Pseudoroseomonas cervicalis]